jgi:lysophospholipase L1-like esterase
VSLPAHGATGVSGPARPSSRRRTALFAIIAVVLGVLMGGVLCEVGLRIGGYTRSYFNPLGSFHQPDALIGFRGKPNFTGRFRTSEFDAMIAHDANGFRRQEHQNSRAGSRHKVLIFGDSFTWGWGVSQGEVFTDQMSLLMPGYYVMNFGLDGTGTLQQLRLFEAYGEDQVAPGDTVLVMFFGNDFSDNLYGLLHAEVRDGQVQRVGPTKQIRAKGLGDTLKDSSYFINLVVYAADRITAAIKRRAASHRAQLASADPQSPELVALRYCLSEFQRTCAARGARFVAAYIPQQGELGEDVTRSSDRALAEAALRQAFFSSAAALNIPTIDLLPAFLEAKRNDRSDRLTFPRDEHWNEHGHAVAAQAIARWIHDADAPADGTPPA